MSGIVPPYLTPSQLCINNETYKAFVFSYRLFCVLRLKLNYFITLIINEVNYIYSYLFCFYKESPQIIVG